MSSTIWLLSEDPSDAEIVRLILQKQGFPIRVESVGLTGIRRGIVGLAHELVSLVEATRVRMETQDCIAVLIDAEFEKPLHERNHHKQIADVCSRYEDQVALVLAVQEIEAWLLADSGICAYVGEQPTNHDRTPNPKGYLVGLLRHKKRRNWRGFDRQFVTQQLAGDGDKFSPSLRKALRKLRDHLHRHGITF